ncbi:MAG: transposase [Roseobacter sp.]
MVDSTRLKVFGAGEWLEQKHKARRKWRAWRKLNLGFVSGEIVFSDLTKDDVGDPTALPGLLNQIDQPVTRFLVDGAYDGDPRSDFFTARIDDQGYGTSSQKHNTEPQCGQRSDSMWPYRRDRCLREDASQRATGYNQHIRGETLMAAGKQFLSLSYRPATSKIRKEA